MLKKPFRSRAVKPVQQWSGFIPSEMVEHYGIESDNHNTYSGDK